MPPKKDKPKEKPPGWNFDLTEGLLIILLLTGVIGTLVPYLFNYLTSGSFSFFGFKLAGVFDFFKSNVAFFKALGFVVAGGAAIGTFVFTKLSDAIWLAEKAKMYPADMMVTTSMPEVKNALATRWEKIIKLADSENQSDWRLAVIEADIILSELLDKLQLPGETMGDKLKVVEKSDFTTIDSAWEAHKARNMIAHEGQNFLVNKREIRRIISLYESVFKEFFLI